MTDEQMKEKLQEFVDSFDTMGMEEKIEEMLREVEGTHWFDNINEIATGFNQLRDGIMYLAMHMTSEWED